MRKLLLAAAAAALTAVAVVPAFAQDTAPTLAELVVASAGAETPEFSTLLAAVQAADPAVLEALSNPDAQLTVFAPTDAAFAALAEALGEEAFNGILADQAALSNILLYHVVDGVVTSDALIGMFPGANQTIQIPTLNGQRLGATLREDNVIELEGGATITAVDITASNGVVHVIDAVLVPESRTIADIVVESAGAETPEFSTLLAAVGAADPAVLATLSDPEAELTVFAPTDAAFAALAAALGEEAFNGILADQAALSNILLYHVYPGLIYAGDLGTLLAPPTMGEATPEPGMEMTLPEGVVVNEDGSVTVTMANGATATVTATEEGVFINDAQIVGTDIDAANGVIHVINAVIVPPAE